MKAALQLDARDTVLIALRSLRAGETITHAGEPLVLQSDVPAGHKFAVRDCGPGDPVLMYGVLVGRATEAIARGACLTTANLRHDSAEYSARSSRYIWNAPDATAWQGRRFFGYPRADGQVGTRNYWIFVPLVFCENRNLAFLEHAFAEELGYGIPNRERRHVARLVEHYRQARNFADRTLPEREEGPAPRVFENIDGVRLLAHQGGCGGTREDSDNLCRLIAGYLHNPNVAGATILGLGCQNAQAAILLEEIRRRDPGFSKPLVLLDHQSAGTERALMERAMNETFEGMAAANNIRRQPFPLAKLTVGLKCGGSDGFSGVSANPAIGYVSDLLATLGGRTFLSEFPELCGVEQNLVDRCQADASAEKFISLMRDYAARAQAVGSGFDMNPSPGNIRDGLITDAMKSAGAARKGGSSPIADVLDYPEYGVKPGLNLLCTPGNDVECVTAQAAAGATIVLFTTGMGTPTGNPVAPVVKIASSTPLSERMPDLIDIDTGPVLRGEATIEQMGEQILDTVVKVASGTMSTRAELLRQYDFIPWKRGVSL